MNHITIKVLLAISIMLIAACGGDGATASSEGESTDSEQPIAAGESSTQDTDYTFTIDFSNGETITHEEGRIRYREARTNFGRAEAGGLEFDSTVTRRTDTEVTVEGNSLRVYVGENIVIGQNAITEMVAQTVFNDTEGTELETGQRVDCDLDGNEANVIITAFDGERISGEFDGILLEACRDAAIGGVPIDGASLIVSGSFENVPFTDQSANSDTTLVPGAALSEATITGEVTMLDNDDNAVVTTLDHTLNLATTLTYRRTDDDGLHEFEVLFEPASGNGFIEDTNYRLSDVEFAFEAATDGSAEFIFPDDVEDAELDYTLNTATFRQTSFEPSDWNAITGSANVTLTGMTASGDLMLTIPLIDDSNDQPAGEITLTMPFVDAPIENAEEYEAALNAAQSESAMLQAMSNAVEIELTGVDLTSAAALYDRIRSGAVSVKISQPDAAFIEIGIDEDASPGTYTPQLACTNFRWQDACMTVVIYAEAGSYTEYTQNFSGEIVVESLIPLRGTVDITAEDIAGNAVTVTGALSDVPFPIESE